MATRKSTPRKRPAVKAVAKRSTARSSRAPDAVAVLKDDHRQVEALFKTFEGLGPRANKRKADVVGKIIESLAVHAAIEEEVFYPEVRRAVPGSLDEVLEALEEHHVVKWTLSELEKMTPDDERFTAKVTVLMESVRHHVKEEEKEMFPHVRKAMAATELQELGDRLRAAKKSAPTRPHPRSPDTPPGNIVAAALTAPLDAAASVAQGAAERVRDLVT